MRPPLVALVSRVGGARAMEVSKRTSTRAALPKTALDETDAGAFKRTASIFRDAVSCKPGSRYPAQPGRYHLYVSKACPWANRVMAVLALKGLEDVIEVHSVHPTWKKTRPDDPSDGHSGWVFSSEGDEFVDDYGREFPTQGCTSDRLNGCRTIRDLYTLNGGMSEKFTVPVLWCSQERRIVNNESSELCRMLNREFQDLAKNKDLDLYPIHLEDEIAGLEGWIYHQINDGVYKCGFASTQEAYDEAVEQLYSGLDRAEEILSRRRYLCGDRLTGIDIWFFMTLIRFDEVYVVYFKCSKKCIREFENLYNYVKDLYQCEGGAIGKTVDFWHIRTHYFTSHRGLNPFGIVPARPRVDYTAPHNRDKAFA